MRAAMILTSVLALAACNFTASANDDRGPRTQRGFEVGAFDRVALGGSHDVVVTVGGVPSVRAEGSAKALERLEIKVENGVLGIGTKEGNWVSFGNNGGITVYVTTPSLAGASIGGSGDMRIDKVEGGSFAASIGGSGDMRIAALKVAEASFSVAGSGGVTASGAADKATISVAGSGDIDASGLETKNSTVSVVGSGEVRARAMETASVSMMGSGDVSMEGSARCTVNKRGSGDVRCGNTG